MSKNRVHDARRREFLSALAAFGAATLVRGPAIARQADRRASSRREANRPSSPLRSPRWSRRHAEIKRQGWETFQDYKPSQSLEAMDKAGIQTAYLSVTNPGVWFTDDYDGERQTAVALARDMNEFAARMVADYKGRFGLFATLPLRDIDASLREIEYAFDTLKADGVGLVTSYGDMWLGDVRFQPIFDELNRRRAIVYTHPTDGTCCHNLLPNTQPGTVEWNTDTGDRSTACSLTGFRGAAHRARPNAIRTSRSSGRMAVERCSAWSDASISGIRCARQSACGFATRAAPQVLFRHRRLGESCDDAGAQDARWPVADRLRNRLSVRWSKRSRQHRAQPAALRVHRSRVERHRTARNALRIVGRGRP
jgi:hypothetical protein